MHNDTKTKKDRVKHSTHTPIHLIVLSVIVIIIMLLAGHYDYQALKAGLS